MILKDKSAECVRKNYDRIMLNIKKGTKFSLQKEADKKSVSLSEYIREAIKNQYKSDTGTKINL